MFVSFSPWLGDIALLPQQFLLFLSCNSHAVWCKVGLSKGRDFKVDSVKFESLLPDLMQPLQVKWFVSKGQRLPIGHST